jgi:hypothetical protein
MHRDSRWIIVVLAMGLVLIALGIWRSGQEVAAPGQAGRAPVPAHRQRTEVEEGPYLVKHASWGGPIADSVDEDSGSWLPQFDEDFTQPPLHGLDLAVVDD